MSNSSSILQHFLTHCQRYQHLLLGFLSPDEDVWECTADPSIVAVSLAENFSREELIDSGVVEPGVDGSVTLNSSLVENPFIILRSPVTGDPLDLMTDGGCLIHNTLPVFAVLEDARTQQFLSGDLDPPQLLVAFDIEDVVLLRSCGIAACVAAGLENSSLSELDRFCQVFGVERKNRRLPSEQFAIPSEYGNQQEYSNGDPVLRFQQAASNSGEPNAPVDVCEPDLHEHSDQRFRGVVSLILVSWMPANLCLAVSTQFKPVLDHLRDLEKYMDVDINEILSWEPSEHEIERLQFIAEDRSPEIFQDAMRGATEDAEAVGLYDARMNRGFERKDPDDLVSALRKLRDGTSPRNGFAMRPLSPDREPVARENVLKCLEENVIDPIRQSALEHQDPVERTRLLGIADLSNQLHLMSLGIQEKLRQSFVQPAIGRQSEDGDVLTHYLAMAKQLFKIIQGSPRCHTTPTAYGAKNVIDCQTTRRLTHFD